MVKKLSAALLILLLLFVNAVKFLHSHNNVPAYVNNCTVINKVENQKNPSKSSAFFLQNCSICNFHLIKDVDHFVIHYSIAATALPAACFETPNQKSNTAAMLCCSNKGPPGLV